MSPNELSNALECFLALIVYQRSAKTTYKRGWTSFVVIAAEGLRAIREHFWKVEKLTVTIMSNFLQSDVRKKKNENHELSSHSMSN